MALFDELMGALKKALEDKAGPVLKKAAEVMDEFEVGVELARRHGQALVQAAKEAHAEGARREGASVQKDSTSVVDAEVEEAEVERK